MDGTMRKTQRIAPVIATIVVVALTSASALAQTTNTGQARRGRSREAERGVYKARIVPHWFAGDTKFWYRNDLRGQAKEFILVDAEKGTRQPAFDHEKLAAALSKAANQEYKSDQLTFSTLQLGDDGKTVKFEAADKSWECNLDDYKCTEKPGSGGASTSSLAVPDAPVAMSGPVADYLLSPAADDATTSNDDADDEPRGRRSRKSPDGKWTASVRDGNLFVRSQDGAERQLSTDGATNHAYGLVEWSPESDVIVAWRIEPGDRKEVFNIESSPSGGGRAILHRRPCTQAGDKFTHYEVNLFDVATGKQTKPMVDVYEHEWEPPRLHWLADKHRFAYEQVDRGHQRLRVIAVDSRSGDVHNLVDEKSATFIWTAHTEMLNVNYINWLDKSDELIYVSERDGWRHLYLIDTKDGSLKNQVTKGPWVVRGIDRIDEDARQVWFHAGGVNAGQDPYFVHYYRINFDGTGLTALTEGDGNHTVQYSDSRKYIIDTYGRVDMPPVHNLRRTSDGSLVCELEKADISELKEAGWEAPEVFVAKGRDGETEIWGMICRPKDLDPAKKYPVLEEIYAGPQGAYVPKSFSGARRFSSYTDLGFIVVEMDAMGTAFRSKAFHDVCWHNLKDAGFPGPYPLASRRGGKISLLRHQPRRDIWHFGGRPKTRAARFCFHPGFLQGRRGEFRLPRQPLGQGIMERAVDGLSGRAAIFRVLKHRQRVAPEGKTLPHRWGNGQQRAAGIDHAICRCIDPRQKGFRSVSGSRRGPRHPGAGLHLRRAAHPGFLCPHLAGQRAARSQQHVLGFQLERLKKYCGRLEMKRGSGLFGF